MIGLTGIGGVVLVPALTEFAGVGLDAAVGTSAFAFVLPAAIALVLHLRRAKLHWRTIALLCVPAAAGAALGAATLGWLPARGVRLFIALLCVGSGVHALAPRPSLPAGIPSDPSLALLGLAVGYASAISGTGGPVTLIPLLLVLGAPLPAAIALGVAAQLPITLAATAVNAAAGRIDYALGALLGVLITGGIYSGVLFARRLSLRELRQAVALTLLGVGLWYGYTSL
jgi:uncharacterized membrane protein YfcA